MGCHHSNTCNEEKPGDKRSLALELVKKNGMLLQHCPAKFRHDREIVFQAVSTSGMALRFASKELRRSRKIVEKAVAEDPRAIQFADASLKSEFADARMRLVPPCHIHSASSYDSSSVCSCSSDVSTQTSGSTVASSNGRKAVSFCKNLSSQIEYDVKERLPPHYAGAVVRHSSSPGILVHTSFVSPVNLALQPQEDFATEESSGDELFL
jgi:hypothetical protein